MSNIKHVTDATFESEVLNGDKPVLLDFWAEWCGPCQALGPKLEEIANEMSDRITVAKINVDENKQTAVKYGVRGIPTMILFSGGKDVDQITGNIPKEQIVTLIENHA